MKLNQIKNRIEYALNSISPVNNSLKAVTIDAILEFIFIFLFVVIFKPYVINDLSITSIIQVAIITAFVFSFFSWVYNNLTLKKIVVSKWTYKKDIVRYSKLVFVTGTIFMGYAYYALHYIYANEITSLVNNFFIVGFLYISAISFVIYFFLKFSAYFNANLQFIQEDKKEINDEKQMKFVFHGKNNGEVVETTVENLIYVQATGHYLNFFLKKENNVEVKIIRNSLNTIIKKTGKNNNLFQCHRSYIVNLNMVSKIEGNSQKAVLMLNNSNSRKIPITRQNYKHLKKRYTFGEKINSFNENNYLEVV